MEGFSRHGNYKEKPYMRKEILILEECVALARKSAYDRQDFKIRKLLEIIDEVLKWEKDSRTKFIIFTEFIETQKYIGETLESLNYKVAYFNGNLSLDDKIDAKTRFKDDYQFLVSTDSGGEGINLQFCHVMINYDLPWNPMKIEQRIGRIDRIGQEKDVQVYNFLLSDTIEERIREVLDSKLERIAEEFGDDKKSDVLSLLHDEYNFDKIYMEAIRQKRLNEKELERIGINIYLEAKSILEKQDLMVPFSDPAETDTVRECMVDNEENMIRKLVQTYAEYKEVELKEYSKKRNVYYFDQPLKGMKLRNIVFNPEVALENEKYEYINITHPLVRKISNDILNDDSLSFDLEIINYQNRLKGNLFYYRLELTNNEGFVRRHLIPIFINQRGVFDSRATHWFDSSFQFDFKIDLKNDMKVSIDLIQKKAEKILETKIKELMNSTRIDLQEKMDKNSKYSRNISRIKKQQFIK